MNKVKYEVSTFKDYNNESRTFILCAAINDTMIENRPYRHMTFGVSFQHPKDKNNIELGKKIALGKAIKNRDGNEIAGRIGILNNVTIDFLINSEIQNIKKHPEQYIKGWSKYSKTAKKKSEKTLTNDKMV